MFKSALLVIALCAMPAAAFAAEAATAPAGQTSTTVEIHNMQFTPRMLTVAPGTKVTWVNEDEAPHTVTEKNRVFRSDALDTKDNFSYTFTTPGEFTYFCTIHPMMVGKIIVKPASS